MSTTINKTRFQKYGNYNIKDEYQKGTYLYYLLLKNGRNKIIDLAVTKELNVLIITKCCFSNNYLIFALTFLKRKQYYNLKRISCDISNISFFFFFQELDSNVYCTKR